MQRFAARSLVCIILLLIANISYSDEEQAYYVIPVKGIQEGKHYSKEELELLFKNLSTSMEGKVVWGLPKLVNKKGQATAVMFASSPVGSAEGDRAASCYRCGMGREDIVTEEDCKNHNLKWKVEKLQDLHSCN